MPELPTGTVTFLFTDVEGSTKLLQQLGAESYGAALAEHRRVLRDAFASHGGVEVDSQGDAFFVAFADARSAVSAALKGQQALGSGPIRVRMGLHTGIPHLGREGYVGEDVHLGARIAAAGHGAQVLLSKATRELVDEGVLDLGEHRLKDFGAPVWIYQLGTDRFAPLKTISNTNLPRPASSFVGRDREVAEISALLSDGARMVTLTGPGGTGKTRLSIEAATELVPEFRAGVFWVPLASLRDPALVTDTIARTLGAKDSLTEHIGEREMLLVLDNLEQVITAAPELATLVESCPNARMLVTSRELLRVRGEVEYAVQPLADPEAAELFSARSGLAIDATIEQLCRQLENLPLAVELAAARVNVLSPNQILERLSGRLDLLQGGRDVDARQKTLRDTIEWSHDLLSTQEQDLFRRLAIFRGGCTLGSAEQVAEANLNTLESLVDKSLVRHTGERFWMLETIREYAAERLAESPVARPVAKRHAEHFLALGVEAEPHLLTGAAAIWHDQLGREHENLRAALDYFESTLETEQGMRLAGAIAEFWDQRGHHEEALRRYARLLEADERPTAARAKALDGASMIAPKRNDLATASRWSEEALGLHRLLGDEFGVAIALWQLGYIRLEEGNFGTAEEMLTEAVDILRRVGDEGMHVWAARTLAFTYYTMGDLGRARRLYEENLHRSRELGDQALEAATLGGLSSIALREGRMDDAIDIEQQSLRLVIHLNDELMAVSRLCNSASVLAAVGRPEGATRLVAYATSRYEETRTSEPWVLKLNDETVASVQKQIGGESIAAAWAEGAALTPERALDLALAEMQAASEQVRR